MLILAGALWCAGPAAAQPAQGPSPFLNLQHTIAVRKAFLLDPELAPLNLGVKVENRVAYLWGPVPSTKTLARAIKAVQNLPDILEIRNNLYVDETEEVMPKFLPEPADLAPQPKNRFILPAPPPVPSGVDKAAPGKQTSGNWQKPASEAVSFKATIKEVGNRPEDQALFVLPAIAIPVAPPPSTPPVPAPLAVKSLNEQLAQIKNSDRRYQHLQISLQDNRVYLNGAAAQWADVHQLAKAIAGVPGVENVIIGQVQVSAAK